MCLRQNHSNDQTVFHLQGTNVNVDPVHKHGTFPSKGTIWLILRPRQPDRERGPGLDDSPLQRTIWLRLIFFVLKNLRRLWFVVSLCQQGHFGDSNVFEPPSNSIGSLADSIGRGMPEAMVFRAGRVSWRWGDLS